MLKILAIVVFSLFLLGCSTTNPITKVLIPVAAKQWSVAIPPRPYLPIKGLTNTSSYAEIAKAYVSSVNLLINDNTNLRSVIDAYKE